MKASEYWANMQKNVKSNGAHQFLKKELQDRNDTRKFIRTQKTKNGLRDYVRNLAGHMLRSECTEKQRQLSGRKRLRSKFVTQEFNDICSNIGDNINSNMSQPSKKKQKRN